MVCHRSVVDFDVELFTSIFKFRARELSAIISDNSVWNAEPDYNVLQELFCLSSCNLGYRLGLNPLGELVNGDEKMCETTRRFLQRADHVEPPGCKWPSDWDSLQLLCRHVYLPSKILASLACTDDGIRICNSSQLEE